MACFADVNVSQGSVATYAMCGGIFNMHLTANLQRNLPVIFFKSVNIWQNYGHESVAPFFGPPCRRSLLLQMEWHGLFVCLCVFWSWPWAVQNGWSDNYALWWPYSHWLKEPCINLEWTLVPPGTYDESICDIIAMPVTAVTVAACLNNQLSSPFCTLTLLVFWQEEQTTCKACATNKPIGQLTACIHLEKWPLKWRWPSFPGYAWSPSR